MWTVNATEEYLAWFGEQPSDAKEAILARVVLLQTFGPQLARPYADTLKGSSLGDLKELRARTEAHVLRIAFLFDEEREALLLIGGDKKGKNEKDFYRKLIQNAETILARYRR
jgi:hypothetical protein